MSSLLSIQEASNCSIFFLHYKTKLNMGRSEGLKRHKYIMIIKSLKLYKQVGVLPIRIVKSNVSSVGPSLALRA